MTKTNYYLSPTSKAKYTVPEATEILSGWGLSHNDKKTRDLINKGKISAEKAGKNPNDHRSGYVVKSKALYDFITSEIPLASEVMQKMNQKEPVAK